MSTNRTFNLIPAASWGFQPLQPVSECRDHQGRRLGTHYKRYRNAPDVTPGQAIWVYAIENRGGWTASSQVSEDDLKAQVLKLRHPKMPAITN